MAYQDQIQTKTAVIESGQSLSAAVDIEGMALLAVVTPAAWTAAALSFEKSADGMSYYPAYDKAAELTVASGIVATAEARWFSLDPTLFTDAKRVKVRSGLNGAAVNQGAARSVTLVLKPI